MERRPSKNEPLTDTQLISCLVDEISYVYWRRDNFLPVLWAVFFNIVPGGFSCILYSLLEFFGGIDFGIVNPFLILDVVMICSEQVSSEVKRLDFLWREFSSENIKVFAALIYQYTRESRLARKRLLFK